MQLPQTFDESIVGDYLKYSFETTPSLARVIVNKCINASRAREAARKAREYKNALQELESVEIALLAKDITITNSSVDFKVKIGGKNERVKTGIPGRFSVYNSLAAIAIAENLGANAEEIKDALLEVRVPGRSELVDNKKGLTIMVDYAHSPESLQNILSAVKSYTRGRVISVFGCGGDRDPGKRPIMGQISGNIADFTIITSDNPRTEEPEKIVKQIEEGMIKTKGKYVAIVDRTDAIKHAIEIANKNDIIVLAGKGHETYQEINGQKYPYDEREIIKEIIG